jgi:hypothetical protein
MRELHSVHFSLQGRSRLPNNMSRLRMNPEMKADLAEIAIAIFIDCVNVAVPFQDALLAVYLSGLQHGQELSKETDNASINV